MPDTFDPDSWPRPQGGAGHSANGYQNGRGKEEDDYDALAFDDQPEYGQQGYGQSYGQSSDAYENYGYDEPTTATSYGGNAGTARRSAQDQGYSAGYDNGGYDNPSYDNEPGYGSNGGYGDESGYDDYDDYDSYDAQSDGSSNTGRKLLGVLAVVVLVVALIIGGKALLGGGKKPQVAAPPADQQQLIQQQQQSQAPPTSAPTDNNQVPPAVMTDLDKALMAWGQFAVNGNLDTVRPYFVNTGKQFARFQTEAAAIQAKQDAGPALQFQMQNAQPTPAGNGDWLVRGTVVVSRSGEQPQQFPWEIRMTHPDPKAPWQVLTVRQV